MSKILIYFTVLRLLEGSRHESAAERFGSTGFVDCLAVRIGSIVALGFKEQVVVVPTSATLEAASGPESLPEDIVEELLRNCGIV
jgi:hypothetical protein